MISLRPGDLIDVRALHADGVAYRWWRDVVEAIGDEKLVAFSPLGREVHGLAGHWVGTYVGRAHYWFERPYNLSEIYYPDGRLLELYVHIASPATLVGHQLTFTDHELDVVLKSGQAPEVVDADEFAASAIEYGYTPEFQAACYRAVAEALDLVVAWKPAGVA